MPDQQLTNPGGAFGAPVQTGKRTMPLINGTTSTVLANSVVAATSAADQKFYTTSVLDDTNVLGVLDADTPAGSIGDVCVEGYHLVAISSSAVPAYKALLGVSTALTPTSSSPGLVKTSTLALTSVASPVPMGSILGIAQSSTLDTTSITSQVQYVLAYIHKM